ncbi:hypothetical protein CANARDRAFT_107599 [[Candida] arabinofermentans NRRL YB-2248]|uniref:Uncharacterized protein n=1 Tax=[Candida] arabinofermentans NRRL YB-2248 TaxID=983967 RepID=A0A1E4STQ9_9ASCO|nr:hypothetical protein CANARDRAFT_107599 [[Candida] arabinofermentans NRRL YB-2248]
MLLTAAHCCPLLPPSSCHPLSAILFLPSSSCYLNLCYFINLVQLFTRFVHLHTNIQQLHKFVLTRATHCCSPLPSLCYFVLTLCDTIAASYNSSRAMLHFTTHCNSIVVQPDQPCANSLDSAARCRSMLRTVASCCTLFATLFKLLRVIWYYFKSFSSNPLPSLCNSQHLTSSCNSIQTLC